MGRKGTIRNTAEVAWWNGGMASWLGNARRETHGTKGMEEKAQKCHFYEGTVVLFIMPFICMQKNP